MQTQSQMLVPVVVQQGFSEELLRREEVSTSGTWGQLNGGNANNRLPVFCGLHENTSAVRQLKACRFFYFSMIVTSGS